jgi:Phasin protein
MPNRRRKARNRRSRGRVKAASRGSAEKITHFPELPSGASQQTARNGFNLLEDYADLFRSTVETTAGLVAQLAEGNAGGYGQLFTRTEKNIDQLRDRSPRTLETVGFSSETMGEILGESMRLVQRQTQHHIHYWNLLVRCRRPQDVLIVQTELLHASSDNALESWRRITDKIMGLSEDIASELTRDAA